MDWRKARSVETKIARLTREIAELDDFFYNLNQKDDRVLYAGMLERKRDDIIRAGVLQLHTAIEDILDSYILCTLLNVKPEERTRKARGEKAKSLRKMLTGATSIGFDMKLNFAAALGLLSSVTKKKLTELNELRNRCSHNWLLKVPVRRGKRPRQKKPPLLSFRGDDLHKVAVFKSFAGEYGVIYSRLFVKFHS